MDNPKKKYKTGLVLSGGALRGFAHAGVLKALNEIGIYPDVISGASAGSIVGAFYADGFTPDEIYEMFYNKKLTKYLEFCLPNKGLVRLTGLYKTLLENLRAKTFEELKLPLWVAVTNLQEAKCEYFSQGDLPPYVIASSTVPVMFQPMVIDGVTYVDGGILNNLPLEPIENDCEMLIGVNVNHIKVPMTEFDGMMGVADRSIHMMISEINKHKIPKFDIYIEPQELYKYSLFNMSKGKEMRQIGYKETKRVLKEKGY
jgi:NTE family protein